MRPLHTQFFRDNKVELHPDLDYSEGESVLVSSEQGEHEFVVKLNEDLRLDSVLISNNTLGVNMLTPQILSDEGDNACYQEVKVKIERIKE